MSIWTAANWFLTNYIIHNRFLKIIILGFIISGVSESYFKSFIHHADNLQWSLISFFTVLPHCVNWIYLQSFYIISFSFKRGAWENWQNTSICSLLYLQQLAKCKEITGKEVRACSFTHYDVVLSLSTTIEIRPKYCNVDVNRL